MIGARPHLSRMPPLRCSFYKALPTSYVSAGLLFLLQANAEQAHKPFDFGLLNVYDFS